MKKKVKIYGIKLSTAFPVTHIRAGEPTQFVEAFISGQGCEKCPNHAWCDPAKEKCVARFKKLHTIRANYELWKERIEAVQRGEAVIHIRVWNGKPYRSKTTLIASLSAEDGVGLQKLTFLRNDLHTPASIDGRQFSLFSDHLEKVTQLANNDGLCFVDWAEWFEGYDLSKPLAIIHFTKFRY